MPETLTQCIVLGQDGYHNALLKIVGGDTPGRW
jgi:hypothetical protein